MAPIQAAAWQLEVPSVAALSATSESIVLPDDGRKGADESIFDPDYRTLVDEYDFADGGKFRSVVKIQSCFKNKNGKPVWMIGTGWLVRPDLLVTAGHVVFDWKYQFGASTQIKCYIGYNGASSVGSPTVQARYGRKVVTTGEWINEPIRPKDVAFIQLQSPFTGNLRPIAFTDTPSSGDKILGVVGYPGDRNMGDEIGAQMFELFERTDYDLDRNPMNMIEYRISTYAGQSGAPILCKGNGKQFSIGTHCYGGGNNNSGSIIGGQYGNNYNGFIELFDTHGSNFGTPQNVARITTKEDGSISEAPFPGQEAEAEGFFDTLKDVARVGGRVLPFASPFLGPMGAPLSVVVGTLANTILAESLGQESATKTDETASRALLAEAALQKVLNLSSEGLVAEITKTMAEHWSAKVPNIDILAPLLLPSVTRIALDIFSDHLTKLSGSEQNQESDIQLQRRPLGINIKENMDAFTRRLLGDAVPTAGEEGLFDSLGSLLLKGVEATNPILGQVANEAVRRLAPVLRNAESSLVSGSSESAQEDGNTDLKAIRILLRRYFMAECAYQAVKGLSEEQIRELEMIPQDDGTEGFFDSFRAVARKLSQDVSKATRDRTNIFESQLVKIRNAGANRHANSANKVSFTRPLPDISFEAIAAAPVYRSARMAVYVNEDSPPIMTTRPPDF
ncbi:hypothetical protein G7Z17_g50 [Cylindrodendrum hubeiense]|uniref:Serine protease n=1 Tax=Cylindrodendrum hubeiense TaxID=595255 RepID=A0A9P5HHG1_9HYPO|nr:hypothetical protein G7Z17_g50 [Cylindrodendrum hubeiense]